MANSSNDDEILGCLGVSALLGIGLLIGIIAFWEYILLALGAIFLIWLIWLFNMSEWARKGKIKSLEKDIVGLERRAARMDRVRKSITTFEKEIRPPITDDEIQSRVSAAFLKEPLSPSVAGDKKEEV